MDWVQELFELVLNVTPSYWNDNINTKDSTVLLYQRLWSDICPGATLFFDVS